MADVSSGLWYPDRPLKSSQITGLLFRGSVCLKAKKRPQRDPVHQKQMRNHKQALVISSGLHTHTHKKIARCLWAFSTQEVFSSHIIIHQGAGRLVIGDGTGELSLKGRLRRGCPQPCHHCSSLLVGPARPQLMRRRWKEDLIGRKNLRSHWEESSSINRSSTRFPWFLRIFFFRKKKHFRGTVLYSFENVSHVSDQSAECMI